MKDKIKGSWFLVLGFKFQVTGFRLKERIETTDCTYIKIKGTSKN
jgi:hypothetical protein